ncbi:MAG: flavohemoglobin expression-modulating QEGLA motif protein [Myxococcales bacterium]
MTDAKSYLRRLSDDIVALHKPLKVLRLLRWAPRVHARFFAQKARRLPEVTYPPLDFDPREVARSFAALRRRIRGRNAVEALLRAKCDEGASLAGMLAARGTKAFYEHSVRIYGHPRDAFAAQPQVDNLKVAELWAGRPPSSVAGPLLSSAQAVDLVRALVAPYLGSACSVRESSRLTANAAAGPRSVLVRKGATFTPRQARALAHHEGLWHVLTSLNGFRQPVLTVLGIGLPGHTESQEGGGVVSEFLTESISDERYRELGARTLAVDMAASGADYLQVFHFLAERFGPHKAAQMSERVFRGGLLTGGAPFTKDAVYQRGYCRTYSFLRAALAMPEPGLLEAFLCGKMRVDDAPLIRQLIEEGLCIGPTYRPEWLLDRESLMAKVTHSITISRFSVARSRRYYEERAARAVRARRGEPGARNRCSPVRSARAASGEEEESGD